MSASIPFEQALDAGRARRYLNADPAVVMSRESLSFMEEAAVKAIGSAPGAELLFQTMEDVSYRAMKWAAPGAPLPEADMRALMEEHFRRSGLGRLVIQAMAAGGGRAELQGGCGNAGIPAACVRGYLAGAFAAAAGRMPGSFRVRKDTAQNAARDLFIIEARG